MVEALMLAHKEINRLCAGKGTVQGLDIQKREVVAPVLDEEMLSEIGEVHYRLRARRSIRARKRNVPATSGRCAQKEKLLSRIRGRF
jgi:hypothetical protein